MLIILWLIAISFAIYLLKRNALRVEKEHERRRERFSRLMEQLKKSAGEVRPDSEKKEDQ